MISFFKFNLHYIKTYLLWPALLQQALHNRGKIKQIKQLSLLTSQAKVSEKILFLVDQDYSALIITMSIQQNTYQRHESKYLRLCVLVILVNLTSQDSFHQEQVLGYFSLIQILKILNDLKIRQMTEFHYRLSCIDDGLKTLHRVNSKSWFYFSVYGFPKNTKENLQLIQSKRQWLCFSRVYFDRRQQKWIMVELVKNPNLISTSFEINWVIGVYF